MAGMGGGSLRMQRPLEEYDFYVDSGAGLDSNSGDSPLVPWKTLAKVGATSIAAGSKVGFRRGRTWNELFVAPTSGTAEQPIIYGAYGSGSSPVFAQQDTRAIGLDVGVNDYVWFSGITVKDSTSINFRTNTGSTNVMAFSCLFSGSGDVGLQARGTDGFYGNCRVTDSGGTVASISASADNNYFSECISDLNPNAHGIQVSGDGCSIVGGAYKNNGTSGSANDDGINVFGAANLLIDGIVSSGNVGNGMTCIWDNPTPCSNITIRNSLFDNNDTFGLGDPASGIRMDTLSEDSTIVNNVCSNNESAGIVLEDQTTNVTVTGNTCSNNANGLTCSNGSGTNNTVEDNIMSDNTVDGIGIVSSSSGSAVFNRNALNGNGGYGIKWFDALGTFTLGTGDNANTYSGNVLGETNGF